MRAVAGEVVRKFRGTDQKHGGLVKNALKRPWRFTAGMMVLAIAIFATGCSDSTPTGASGLMPDFRITDVNPNSTTFNQKVSPRSYIGSVSAWFFGHAT